MKKSLQSIKYCITVYIDINTLTVRMRKLTGWKQAWNIVRIEWKINIFRQLLMLFLAFIYLLVSIFMLNGEMSSSPFLNDLFILFLVWLPILFRGKEYTGQKVENDLYASKFVMLLSQFPITKEEIVKSRFLMSFILNVCLNAICFTIMYFAVESIQAQLGGISAVVFILFWVCVGYQVGAVVPSNEIGATYSKFKLIVYFILFYLFTAVIFYIFHALLNMSLVEWSIYLASEHTLVTLFALIVITILTHRYGVYLAKKAIHRVDYYL